MELATLNYGTDLLKARLAFLKQVALEKGQTDLAERLRALNVAVDKFYSEIAKPVFHPRKLYAEDPPTVGEYNSNLIEIYADIDALTKEILRVSKLEQSIFNYAIAGAEDLITDISGLTSMVVDLNIVAGYNRGDLLVGGDDFTDDSKIAKSFSLAFMQAESYIGGGSIGLARIGRTISDIIASTIEGISFPKGSDKKLYEGLFYAPMKEQRPEGGSLVVKNAEISELPEPIQQTLENETIIDLEGMPDLYIEPTTPQALDRQREATYDSNPETFWEAETAVVGPWEEAHYKHEKQSPEALAPAPLSGRGSFIVGVTLILGEPQPVNILVLNPMQFSIDSTMQVESIYYSNKDTGGMELVPNWNAQKLDRILTVAANKYLTSEQARLVLATTKSAYRGQGIFPFPTVITDRLKVILKVDVGYPIVYERRHIAMENTITITKTVKKRSSWFSKEKKKTTTETSVQGVTIKLSYLQTLVVDLNIATSGEFVDETESSILSSSKSSPTFQFSDYLKLVLANALKGTITKLVAGILESVKNLLKKVIGSYKKTSVIVEESGWEIKKEWLQPYYDKARYAVGVRDAEISRYQYAPISEFVSTPHASPKEIIKIILSADDLVPPDFPPGPTYVKYYIRPELENYDEWHQINPMGRAVIFDGAGNVVPKILNFNVQSPDAYKFENKYITTEEPVKAIRVRAVLTRPEDTEDPNLVSQTPIVRSYRVLLYPSGGL